MNSKSFLLVNAVLSFLAVLPHPVHAQGTAFTYQGRLNNGGNPANGNYDFTFSLFNSSNATVQVGSTLTNLNTGVSNGLFNASLDFGANAPNIFNGSGLWLEIGVRAGGATGAFTTLNPLQRITTAPYAITAGNLSGTLPASQLSGILPASVFPAILPPANGANLTNIPLSGVATASSTNQGLLTGTSFVTLNTLHSVQLTATLFKTPPMGWMSWNWYGNGGATESNVYLMEQRLINTGLKSLGYNLIQIDAGWQGYRDANGFIHESAARFPDGMSNVVAALHSQGFKVGIWHPINVTSRYVDYFSDNNAALINTNFSNEQCLVNDAQTFVNWGMDYVKLEGATNNFTSEDQEQRWYELFVTTAQNLGKPLYIMGAVGDECSPWMYGVINARRSGGFDIGTYDGSPRCFMQFLGNFWHAAAHPEYSGPRSYCSLDAIPAWDPAGPTYMLMVAMMNGELIWDWFQPLGWGVSDAAYLTNLIQLDQDPAALMARSVLTNGTVTVWQKPLGSPASATFALAFFNTATNGPPVSTTISLQNLGVYSSQLACLDLISNTTWTVASTNSFSVTTPPMTAYGFRFSPYSQVSGNGGALTNLNAASLVASETTVGTNYTAGSSDSTILVSATGKLITLPTAIGIAGRQYTVKLIVPGTCTITNATGLQKFDGALSYSLSQQYKSVTVQSDGAQWWIISAN